MNQTKKEIKTKGKSEVEEGEIDCVRYIQTQIDKDSYRKIQKK